MKRRNFVMSSGTTLGALLLPTVAATLSACGGGKEEPKPEEPKPQQPDPKRLVVYPASNDPRLISKLLDSGEQFTLIGEKDSNGKPISLSEFFFVSEDRQSVESFYTLDNSGSLTAITDGTVTTLSGESKDSFVFGLSAGSKQLQISVPKDAIAAVKDQSFIKIFNHRSGNIAASFHALECGCTAPKMSTYISAPNGVINAPIIEVDVGGCIGEKPSVQVILSDEKGVSSVIPAKKIGEKKFAAVLTGNYDGNVEAIKAGESVLKFLEEIDLTGGAFGSIYEYLKDKAKEGIVDAVVKELEKAGDYESTLAEFQQFLGLTDAELASAEAAAIKKAKFSKFLGKGLGLLFKTISVIQDLKALWLGGVAINDLLLADAAMNKSMKFQAKVTTSKGEVFYSATSGAVSPSGPFPGLSVQADGVAEVSSLVLSPASPSSGTPYEAVGVVFCLKKGDSVFIGVIGTDGYTNSLESIIETDGDQSFKLKVPGAAGGVRDSVKLAVNRAGVKIAERTASLIFG